MVIICSILFFCSFFIAVFTQYRAESSLARMLCRCCSINKNWRIKNYERRHDPEFWAKVPKPPSALKKTGQHREHRGDVTASLTQNVV